jgi:hypothetical protein
MEVFLTCFPQNLQKALFFFAGKLSLGTESLKFRILSRYRVKPEISSTTNEWRYRLGKLRFNSKSFSRLLSGNSAGNYYKICWRGFIRFPCLRVYYHNDSIRRRVFLYEVLNVIVLYGPFLSL